MNAFIWTSPGLRTDSPDHWAPRLEAQYVAELGERELVRWCVLDD